MNSLRRARRRFQTALAGGLLLAAFVVAGATAPFVSAQTAQQKTAPAARPAAKKPAAKKPAAKKPPAAPPVQKPAPIDTSHQVWTEARALSDQGRHAEALTMVRERLQRDADNVELRWLEAGICGWLGRHAEAVTLYVDLIADHPEYERRMRGDLAEARLDAGDPAGALADLDVRVIEAPADRDVREQRARALGQLGRLDESLAVYDSLLAVTPGDTHLQMERARVLTWMGRNHEAAAAYQQVLDKDPVNRRARMGKAMNQNWDGRHRMAAASLDSLAAEPAPDPEVHKQLAFARYWNGEPERARIAVERYLQSAPNDREALELQANLAAERGRSASGAYVHSNDTEDLTVDTYTLSVRHPLPYQSMLEVVWRNDVAEDPVGERSPWQLGANVETIWSALITTRAALRHAEMGDGFSNQTLGGLMVTWRPQERVRVDFGGERDLVMTRLALDRGIVVRTWSGGVDWRVDPRVNLLGSFARRAYSDGNNSHTLAGSVLWHAYAKNQVTLTPRFEIERLEAEENPGNGYYAPAQYTELGPGIVAEWAARPDLTLTGDVMLGWQRELGVDWEAFVNASGRVAWVVRDRWTLTLEGGQSNSDLSNAAGYARRYWGLSLSTGF